MNDETKPKPPKQAAPRLGFGHNKRSAAHLLSQKTSKEVTYAALDLGSNSCRLLIAHPVQRGFRIKDAFSQTIRLSEDLPSTGAFSQESMDRAMSALKICAAKIARHGATRTFLVATAACRIATNAGDFLAIVKETLGLDITIISPEQEARLAVAACIPRIDLRYEKVLIFDFGGASCELIWIDLNKRTRNWKSLKNRLEVLSCISGFQSVATGIVLVAHRFKDPSRVAKEFENIVIETMALFQAFEDSHGIRHHLPSAHILGITGTVTTLTCISLAMPRVNQAKVEGFWLQSSEIRRITAHLLSLSHQERAALECIGEQSTYTILAGCAILEALLRIWPVDALQVTNNGLREGMLWTLLGQECT